ncbi:MAG TPA: OmpW family outer membrane protein [Thermoanaerobaculia bacterium]|nr:OmpW family outer membrane protein [Thermoanaerobaculia bacterium]
MKFQRLALACSFLLLASVPARAADHAFDLIGRAAWVNPSGSDRTEDIRVAFDSKVGYGLALNVFVSPHLSAEFGASVVEPDARFVSVLDPASGTRSKLRMIPFTGVLQLHLGAASFDPYIGAGVAYVTFDQVKDVGDLDNVNIHQIDFKNDYGYAGNVGFNFELNKNLALNVDAKYVPLRSGVRVSFAGSDSTRSDVKINPLIISAGLGLRF